MPVEMVLCMMPRGGKIGSTKLVSDLSTSEGRKT